MFRRNKVKLVILFFSLLAFTLPIIAVLQFPQQILSITKMSYLFAPFCLIIPFLPIGKWRIGGIASKPTTPIFYWFLTILLIEIGIISLFLIQNNILTTALIKAGSIYPSPDIIQKTLLPALFKNWGLYPWAFYTVIGICFAYISHTEDAHFPFSSYLFSQSKKFYANIARRITDIYIIHTTKFFVLFNAIFLSLQIFSFFYPEANLFSSIYCFFINCILLLVFFMKRFQKIINHIEKRNMPQGIQIIAIIITITAITLLTYSLINPYTQEFQNLSIRTTIPFSHISNPETTLAIWNWNWWLLGTPLFCSLLIKFSHGRTIRQFISAVLTLPISLLIISFYKYGYGLQDLLTNSIFTLYSTHWIYIPMIISVVLSVYFLLDAKTGLYFWLGYIPTKDLPKSRRTSPDRFWILSITMLSTILLLSLAGAVYFSIVITPLIVIFFVMGLSVLKRSILDSKT